MLYDFLQVENRLAEFNGVVLKTIYKLAKKKVLFGASTNHHEKCWRRFRGRSHGAAAPQTAHLIGQV